MILKLQLKNRCIIFPDLDEQIIVIWSWLRLITWYWAAGLVGSFPEPLKNHRHHFVSLLLTQPERCLNIAKSTTDPRDEFSFNLFRSYQKISSGSSQREMRATSTTYTSTWSRWRGGRGRCPRWSHLLRRLLRVERRMQSWERKNAFQQITLSSNGEDKT